MRTKYHCSRSLLAGFLAVVMLVSLVPAASAAQRNTGRRPITAPMSWMPTPLSSQLDSGGSIY